MTAFDPDPATRWLFCMTHPDDEISICVWIKTLTDAGAEVFLSWTHDTPKRREEGRMAARHMGVPEERLYFHGARDQHAVEHIAELTESFRAMIEQVKPDRVACGAFEQGHIDHDTTNLLVHRTFDGPVFEIPFYHTYLTRRPIMNRFADPTGQEILRLNRQQEKFKSFMARQYPSQAIWRNLILAELRQRITRLKSDRLRSTERMRLQTHTDFLAPNLPPRLAAKVRTTKPWQRWEKAVRAILLTDVQAADAAGGPATGPGSDRRATL